MDYEKKYREALERAKISRLQLLDIGEEATEIEFIFPELKESEGEKTRKELLAFLKENLEKGGNAEETWDSKGLERWIAWLEKQGEQKFKDKYTFNSIPRLLDMIEPTDRAKRYCQKLIDSLQQEGYVTDAKIISEHLKLMNGEEVSMATMDKKQDEKKSVEWSEEDKGFIELLLAVFTNGHPNGLFTTGDITVFKGKSVSSNRIITWLKSLKHRNTWKPNEEQMQTLHSKLIEGSVIFPADAKVLSSLYEDLIQL